MFDKSRFKITRTAPLTNLLCKRIMGNAQMMRPSKIYDLFYTKRNLLINCLIFGETGYLIHLQT